MSRNQGFLIFFVVCVILGVTIGSCGRLVRIEKKMKEDLPMSYEVIKAESVEDAIEKSMWKTGDLARCVELSVSSNSGGTFSVFPEFEKLEIGELELEGKE